MAKQFEKSLGLATDSTVLETNWDAVLDCIDTIRGGEVNAKAAMQCVQKRMMSDNPHVQLHTLNLLEAVVKNCGKKVHTEVATREFMEDFKNLAFEAKAEPVKNKVLELLQCWAAAFAAKPEYKIIVDTHNLMKLAGFEFPSIKEADAMFSAQVAPEWEDGDNCFRCRTAFGLLTRKHHCRHCGQIFCGSCSSKEMLLPQFGIEKPVRVCDACYEKGAGVAVGRPPSTVRTKRAISVPRPSEEREMMMNAPEYVKAPPGTYVDQKGNMFSVNYHKGRPTVRTDPNPKAGVFDKLRKKWAMSSTKKEPQPTAIAVGGIADANKEAEDKARREKEEEEYQVQLALALSQSEAEAKEQDRQRSLYSMYNGVKSEMGALNLQQDKDTSIAPSEQPIGIGYKGTAESIRESPSETSLSADDPLARYLNRDYWQTRKTNADNKVEQWEVNPSAPLPSEPSLGGGSCAPTIRGSPVPGAGPQKENVYGVGTGPMLDEETRSKSDETIKFVADIQEQVESMENRIRSNVARGRPIINDTAIQGLYTRLTELHAHVLQRMNEFDVQRTYFESLQDHLGHITEARSAIDALREEEERKRAELAAQEQQMRQAQMQHKLGVMRQQKHDMLMYQRQIALQRFQQQEADMAARRQQQQAMPHQYYGYQTPTSMPPSSGYAPGGQPPAYTAYQQSYGMPPQQQGAYPGYAPVQQQQQHGATPTPSMQQHSATPPVSGYNQQPAQHQQQSNGYNAQVAAQQQPPQYHHQQPQQAALPQQQQPANGYHQAQQPTGAPGAQVHQAPNNAYPQQQQPAQVAPSSHSVTPVVQSTGSPYPAASAAPAAYAPPPASLVQYAAQAVAHQQQHHTPQPGAGGYEQQGQQPPQYTQQQQQQYYQQQQQQQYQQQHPTSPPYQPQQQQPAAPAQSYAAPPVAAVQQPPAQEEMLISFD